MRVTIYDKNPGQGFSQWFLKTSWLVGCFIQKLFGKVDDYFGASSWEEASAWLEQQPTPILSIQYWGHGSPGRVWLAQRQLRLEYFDCLMGRITRDTVIWFRTCSTFQGTLGLAFSQEYSTALNCTIAGHTRIIGPLQGGLRTRTPGSFPSWSVHDTEFSKYGSWIPVWARWGDHTVTCLATKIPEGW
jgi:hypothetical protein